MTGCCQVTTAIDEAARAEELAATIVAERLAACVQVLGPATSTYWWEGAVRTDREWLIVARTTEARLQKLMDRIRALHRYDLPEIVAYPITAGDPAYLRWIRRETTPPTPETV